MSKEMPDQEYTSTSEAAATGAAFDTTTVEELGGSVTPPSTLCHNGTTVSFVEDGGVTSARGFRAGGVHAGFRQEPERLDTAAVVADELCPAAATFTQNLFCAAPVIVSKEHLGADMCGLARAVVINSGNANAATGEVGLEAARTTAYLAAEAFDCTPGEVLLASTGVIGQILDAKPFIDALPQLRGSLQTQTGEAERLAGGHDAARAIMTTDTAPKEAAVTFVSHDPAYEGITFTVGGMAKGSGMIMPNMATMIAVLTTDAPVAASALRQALVRAVGASFNKVTVDSDTSTNDSCFLFASGKACTEGSALITEDSLAFQEFSAALEVLTQHLARMMARDGEGATKLVTVKVRGAASPEDADAAARTVANSPLVKTAIFGRDANWGRIAGALGRSGAQFNPENVSISIMGIPVCENGLTVPFSEDEARRRFELPEIVLEANLGAGSYETTIWTCDFSHDYVTINGDYRT